MMSWDSTTLGEANFEQQFEFTVARPDPPPLRIHHLMACAAVAAVQLSLWRIGMPPSENLTVLIVALNSMYEVLGAIGVTLGILSIYWHIKGYAGLVQPGQWLLFGYAVRAIPLYLMTLLVRLGGFNWAGTLRGDGGGALWIMANVLSVVIYYVIPFAFFVFCAWKIADTHPWRLVFAFIAITTVLTTNWVSHLLISYWNVPISAAVAIPILAQSSVTLCIESWAVATDFATRRARFWTHWAGIGLSIIKQVLFIGGSLLTLLGWF